MWTISDIDECSNDGDNCHDNATCTNTDGSFTCACNVGYQGNGTHCAGNIQLLKLNVNLLSFLLCNFN